MRSPVSLLVFFLFQFLWNAHGTTYNWGGAYVSFGTYNCTAQHEVTAFAAGVCAQTGFLNYRLYECDNTKLTVWNCFDSSCNTASSCSIFIQETYGTCVYDTTEQATYTYNCWADAPQLQSLDRYLKVEYFPDLDCGGDPYEYQIYELNVCDGVLKYDCNDDGNVDVYDCSGSKQSTEKTGSCFTVFGEPTSYKFTCGKNAAASLTFHMGLLSSLLFLMCFWM